MGRFVVTQELLDLCGQHPFTADVEAMPIRRFNEARNLMPWGM